VLSAVWRLADEVLLARIAPRYEDSNVRQCAVRRLTDVDVLAKVAANDKDLFVRFLAKDRLAALR
jgi:hypothetical protein